jgi:hypothetical protein
LLPFRPRRGSKAAVLLPVREAAPEEALQPPDKAAREAAAAAAVGEADKRQLQQAPHRDCLMESQT